MENWGEMEKERAHLLSHLKPRVSRGQGQKGCKVPKWGEDIQGPPAPSRRPGCLAQCGHSRTGTGGRGLQHGRGMAENGGARGQGQALSSGVRSDPTPAARPASEFIPQPCLRAHRAQPGQEARAGRLGAWGSWAR